jgi:hypothetical protein
MTQRSTTRSIPDTSAAAGKEAVSAGEISREVVETVKVLIAMLYTIQNHLHAD